MFSIRSRDHPSGDPCDFLSSSVTDLKRILQGNALFSSGNEEFLVESCNGEVSCILPGFETRFSSDVTRLSTQCGSGSWLGSPEILDEACNGEVPWILTRFETRLHHDPAGFITQTRFNLSRILMVPHREKSDFQDQFVGPFRILARFLKELIRILSRFDRDLTRIFAGSKWGNLKGVNT